MLPLSGMWGKDFNIFCQMAQIYLEILPAQKLHKLLHAFAYQKQLINICWQMMGRWMDGSSTQMERGRDMGSFKKKIPIN
jgi:hypothetical protein